MKTAQQILESKGYDLNEINDILNYKTKHSDEGLDMKVRTEFGLQGEPLHLWESYYIGDANEETLEAKAKERGFVVDDEGQIDELLTAMDRRLIELCEDIEEKIDSYAKEQVQKIRLGDSKAIKEYGDLFEEKLDDVSDEDLENAIRNYHEVEGFN